MVARRYVDVFEAYDRFTRGEKMKETEWDYCVVPQVANLMKKRYDINFDGKIVPEDQDLVDRLFIAGIDFLITAGVYNTTLERIMHIDEDEIYEGLKMAPKQLNLGYGKDMCVCKARRGNSLEKPVIQGGPTGAPVSESIFKYLIESYAQEPIVDAIVSGIPQTIGDHPAIANSPWEIRATIAEIRNIRNATASAGRPGMGI